MARMNKRILLALLLAAGPLMAQSVPEIPRVSGSAEVSLINLDVVVTDKDGNPVSGLSPADFEVLHGKKPVTITNFREERPTTGVMTNPAPLGSPTTSSTTSQKEISPIAQEVEGAGRPRRRLVLFIDHLALPDPREREEVFGSLKRLLRQSIEPGDEAMIVLWRGSIRKVLPFTGNIAVLEYVLDVAAGSVTRIGGEDSEIAKLARDDAAYAWAGTGDSELSRSLDALQVYADIKGKATALKGLITMMAGMEGRRAVIIVARRFSRRAGAEFRSPIDTKSLIDEVIESANASDVTLHTFNATEWQPDAPSAIVSTIGNSRSARGRGLSTPQMNWMNDMDTLGPMAEKTGGVAIGNTMQAPLFAARVSADLRAWYSIGYPIPLGGKTSADVKVRVNRRGLTVRTRRSVVLKLPEEQMKDRTLANLFGPDPNARLPIIVATRPAEPMKKGHFRVPVQLRIPVRHLVVNPSADGASGAVSVFVVAAGPGGDFSEVTRERYEFALATIDTSQSKDFLTYDLEVETRSADSRVSIAVWDEVGKEAGFRLIRPASH
jgi:VWFA-related protein